MNIRGQKTGSIASGDVDVRICVLGPVRVEVSGVDVDLGGTKPRALLAMLALESNRIISPHSLVDGLWDPQDLPANPRRTIHIYVSRLRDRLRRTNARMSEVSIMSQHGGYSLLADPNAIDLHRFQLLAAQGYAAWPEDPRTCARSLTQAIDEWTGDALDEFHREPFAQAEAQRLAALKTAALDMRIEADLACGKHIEVISELEGLVQADRANERIHAQLMLALYRCGRQFDALAVYRRMRRFLTRELGIEPSGFLSKLEAAILVNSPELAIMDTRSITKTLVPRSTDVELALPDRSVLGRSVGNLPPSSRYFVGRDALLENIRNSLTSSTDLPRVHVLVGTAGVGKSQAAIQYAQHHRNRYLVRWWIDAEDSSLIPPQFAELGRLLYLSSTPGGRNWADLVLAELAHRSDWLLVFDNARSPNEIAHYLPRSAGHVLATSQSRGWGEIATSSHVDVLPRADTIGLLQARLPHLQTDVANRLAGHIGDLPLAAAQAASYIEQTDIDPAEYVRQFHTRTEVFLDRGDVLGYRGRIATIWSISLERLKAESLESVALLEMLALLSPDPVPVDLFVKCPEAMLEPLGAAAKVDPNVVNDAIGAAVKYSLLERWRGERQSSSPSSSGHPQRHDGHST